MQTAYVAEWRIENLSHWCAEVHGESIKSPKFFLKGTYMELYPKGINGRGEHLVVRIRSKLSSFSGEIAFYCSDGSLICSTQTLNAGDTDLDPNPGPKFEDVISIIREDFIIVTFRKKYSVCVERRMCTTINVFKISLKMNPRWIESDATQCVCLMILSPNNCSDGIWLNTCSKNNVLHFTIHSGTVHEYPFALEMCLRLTGSEGTVDNCIKEEHVFRDKSPWAFPNSLEKKEFLGKGISLCLCLKTRDRIQSPSYAIYDNNSISIVPDTFHCLPSTDPVTLSKTQDSVEVLTKDFMCLYQDQKFSDITLKCDNVTFPVHKNILSARSPVLDRLLSSDMKEAASGMVDIEDLDPSTVGLFLTYLYTGSVEEELQSDDRALKLYYAADKYQVPSLKRECVEFLCDNISVTNVCDILSLANRHNDDHLTTVSHKFMLTNCNDLLRSKNWKTFLESEPLLGVKTLTQLFETNSVSFTPLP